MMLFLFGNKENKILYGPPKKGAEIRSCDMATRTCLSIPAACDLDFY